METKIIYNSTPNQTCVIIRNFCSLYENEICIAIECEKDDMYAEIMITTEEAEHLIRDIQSCIDLTRQQNALDEKNNT